MLQSPNSGQDIVELSVSAWFYRNRTIAGFDNPARSLYVSIREIVENSLDACESISVVPEIKVSLQRADETDAEDLFSAGPEKFRLTVEDNGSGIRHEDIPKLIGKMLTGTKFMHKQSRGTFGLGGSLALLYGQVTTQEPIIVESHIRGENRSHIIEIRLDIENNRPEVIEEIQVIKPEQKHGTTISFHLQGDWLRSKRKIVDYFVQTSIIVPYSSIIFRDPDGEILEFEPLVRILPKPPKRMKPHPKGIDVEMLKAMISETKKSTLHKFLKSSFQRVGETIAGKFLDYANIDSKTSPKDLDLDTLVSLMNSFASFDGFLAPSSKSLSPAGIETLEAGMQRLEPELVVVKQRNPSVYEGHPFVVETGIAYGGDLSKGIQLFRFANRIPLLYDERNDVASRVIRELNLKNYGLRSEDPLAFLVHICSTKIPYKTVGKEYIADVDSVRREIDLGFKDCLRDLGKNVRRKYRKQRKRKRENRLRTYYGFITDTLGQSIGREVSTRTLFGEEE